MGLMNIVYINVFLFNVYKRFVYLFVTFLKTFSAFFKIYFERFFTSMLYSVLCEKSTANRS